jgi:hypothetical protein
LELAKAQMLKSETVDDSETQELEADLPAEYTQMKRNVDEDGFSQMESQAKRRKAEEEAKEYAYHYDAQAAENMYGYVQYSEQYEQPAVEDKSGIIPQNVLANLKNISKNVVIAADKPKPVNAGGLGSLADYGSDSDDE